MDKIKTKEEQEAREQEQRNQIETAKNDLEKVLQTPEGRRFFWSVLSECGVFQAPPLKDDRQLLFFEGRRCLGLTLIERLNQVSPELFFQIAKENNNGK